ncbi:universal stress protein [Streptomyces sp. JL2001]|uniref:universal stress protein n=1 Tax=Streptomyces sp. JL2001 TaxID=3342488 RepID=UPI003D807455
MESPLVVGVDGSENSLTAVDWAVDEAVRHGLPLRLVHASLWERYEGVVGSGEERPPGQVLAENITAAALDRARRRAPELRVDTDIVAEDASSALLDEGMTASALVVGSRGGGGMAGLLLGSVSLLVAARAHCPVIVVRGEPSALDSRHARVLLGVGGDEADEPALRFAFREAAARGCELEVAHAWRRSVRDPVHHPLMAGGASPYFDGRAAELLDEVLGPMTHAHPEVRVRRTTGEGPARRLLVERSADADLLVVGARRRGGLIGLELGRIAHRALHHAACPVAVVPRHPAVREGDAET